MYLECRDLEKNKHRFYHLTVQSSLFGTFILTRTWGRIGSKRPRELHQEFADEETMVREVQRILPIRQRHGYLLIQDKQAAIPNFRTQPKVDRELLSR